MGSAAFQLWPRQPAQRPQENQQQDSDQQDQNNDHDSREATTHGLHFVLYYGVFAALCDPVANRRNICWASHEVVALH
jgi:hypothetical protein